MTLWEDNFTTLTADWVTTTLLSAASTSGKLVTEANADTWSDYTKAAVFTPTFTIAGDFVIETDLSWVGRSSDLGHNYLYLKGSDGGFLYAGLIDSQAAQANKKFSASTNGTDTYSAATYDESSSGTFTIKIQRIDGEIKI